MSIRASLGGASSITTVLRIVTLSPKARSASKEMGSMLSAWAMEPMQSAAPNANRPAFLLDVVIKFLLVPLMIGFA